MSEIREKYGRIVRAVWVRWCEERRSNGETVDDHHFAAWEDMPENIREVDMRIGYAVRKEAMLEMTDRLNERIKKHNADNVVLAFVVLILVLIAVYGGFR